MFTKRESMAFSSGRITWLLTCVCVKVSISLTCKIDKVPHRTYGRRDDAVEKRREFEGQHRLAHEVTEVPSQAPVARARRPRERFVYLLIFMLLDTPLCYGLAMATQRERASR